MKLERSMRTIGIVVGRDTYEVKTETLEKAIEMVRVQVIKAEV